MKTFGLFGFEPTFYPHIVYPKWMQLSDEYDWRTTDINAHYTNILRDILAKQNYQDAWVNKFRLCQDAGALETSSHIYSDYKQFKKDYAKLINTINKFDFIESSNVCLQSEGGCHINIDMKATRDKHDNKFVLKMLENYRNYVLSNPSIAWMFLSPYDNESSNLVYKEDIYRYNKGEFMNIRTYSEYRERSVDQTEDARVGTENETIAVRDRPVTFDPVTGNIHIKTTVRGNGVSGSGRIEVGIEDEYQESNHNINIPVWTRETEKDERKIEYVEFRHYMMPRNQNEFDVHFEFANIILFYIYDQTVKGLEIPFENRPIKMYTYNRSIKEFKQVCKQIGFEYNKVVNVGKLPLMKTRFKLGQNYLI